MPGNPQFRVENRVGDVPIVAGGSATIDIPRDYDLEAIQMRIAASVQVTVLATSVRAEAPCQLVPRVELIADGKNTIASAPFWFFTNASERRSTESGARAMTPPSGVAVATYAVEAIGVLDLATVDLARPKDTNFRTAGLSLLQLRFTFGLAADVFVGGTVAYSGSPVVEVSTLKTVEDLTLPPEQRTTPLAVRKVSFQELALASSNSALEVRLPAGNLISQVTVRTSGATTLGEPDASTLNRLTLQSGVDVRYNMTGAGARALSNAKRGQLTIGYYVADLMRMSAHGNNMLANCWDCSGGKEPKAILDVTGSANRVAQIVTTEYITGR